MTPVLFAAGEVAPMLFKECAIFDDTYPKDKVDLVNEALCDYVTDGMKKTHKYSDNDKVTHYQPNTQNRMVRTLLAGMAEHYWWDYTINGHFNFTGGLKMVMDVLFTARLDADTTGQYATALNQKKLSEKELDNLLENIGKFNEDIHKEHVMKTQIFLGLCYGCRSMSEITDLLCTNIQLGTYERGHQLAGKPYVALVNIKKTKTSKISVNNLYMEKTEEVRRMPLTSNVKNDLCAAGVIWRLKEKAGLGQQRLFCYAAEALALNQFALMGYHNTTMAQNKQIGPNIIRQNFKDAAKFLGFENWRAFPGHACRRQFITELSNDPNISLKESMVQSRHKSVSANLTYQKRDSSSEMAKINALEGLFAKKCKKPDDVIILDSDDEPIINLKKKAKKLAVKKKAVKRPAVKRPAVKKLTKRVKRKVGV